MMGIAGKVADLFGGLIGLGSEYIEDKDKRNEFMYMTAELRAQYEIAALQTKTVPWVDALHKMIRPIMGLANVLAPAAVLMIHPDIDVNKLMIAVGGGAGATSIYTMLKGKGR